MKYRVAYLLPLLALAAGCTNDPGFPEKAITVTVKGLPSLGSSADYQIWFSYPEEDRTNIKGPSVNHGNQSYFTVGRFRVDANGALVAPDGGAALFNIPSGYNPGLITDAILTIEATGTEDSIPGPRILGGVFTGTEAQARTKMELTGSDAFGSALALDSTFRPIFLDTPTSAATDDFNRGIWFGIDLSGTIAESLLLPELPVSDDNPDWIYETWLVRSQGGADEYISMGQFRHSGKADSNGAGPNAGPDLQNAYSLPGEDFVTSSPARALNDGSYSVVVSLQPSILNVPRPVIPLFGSAKIPAAAKRRETIPLTATAAPGMEIVVDR